MERIQRCLLWIAFVLISFSANAQNRCGSDVLSQMPAYQARQKLHSKYDQEIAFILRNGNPLRITTGAQTIPVVVHVIHQNGPENLSQQDILQGIQNLNDAYANTGLYEPLYGVDTEISFCLAVRDPQGNFTSGIDRIQSPLTNMTLETQDAAVKALGIWDPTKYLNIWLVAEINSISAGPNVAGYATFPSSHGTNLDGIVEEARWFGGTHNDAKITVHEVGHYLGLYHTFQGGCGNNDCMLDGDHVCDTPPDASTAAVPCFFAPNTCTSDEDDLSSNNPFRPISLGGLGDQADLFENYMDYGYQTCQRSFTQGQKDRMLTFLYGPRASLLNSLGCFLPCNNPVVASFTPNATTISSGGSVTFSNTTTGANAYVWYNNGTQFSTQTSPSLTFNTPGNYEIKLLASNGDPACADSLSIIIEVLCGLQANFTSNDSDVQPGDAVTFTQQSPGSLSYTWLLNGSPIATGSSTTVTFNNLGGQTICLVTDNGQCRDTSCQYISIGDCGRKRYNKWAFGFAGNGLDFTSGSPVWVATGMAYASETSASICDRDGNFLMFTNGVKVWRGFSTGISGVVMPNGDSLYGGFAQSSTQGAIFIPKPLDDSIYYIFTADESAGWPYYIYGGLSYSIVDLTLPGAFGTMGDIAVKNIPLHTPATEKLCAVRHANGCDIWVIGHAWNSTNFLAYKVTPNGVDTVPVISSVGFPHTGGFLTPSTPAVVNTQGQMKISPDGTKLALALQDTAIVEIFDFNKATGEVSNPITYQAPTFNGIYGLEFSPDGSKLYVTRPWGALCIFQMDLSAGSPAAILNSVTTLICQSGNNGILSLQRGPDGKIYGAPQGGNNMLVINNPNAAGFACNLVPNAFTTGQGMSMGLQNSIADYASQLPGQAHGPLRVCQGAQNLNYYFDQASCTDSIVWEIAAGIEVESEENGTLELSFPNLGIYQLSAHAMTACGELRDTLQIEVVPWQAPDLGPDTILCASSSLILSPGAGFQTYLWNNGATSPSLTVNQPGVYTCTTTSNGCEATDTIKLRMPTASPIANLGNDTSICDGGILALSPGNNFLTYRWQDNSTMPSLTIWNPGTYWVEVTDSCGATSIDSITIYLDNSFQISLGNDTVICQGSQIFISPGPGFASYEWQDGSTIPQYVVTSPGTYYVQATNPQGCIARDTIEIDLCTRLLAANGDENPLQLYPVPTLGRLNLRFKHSIKEEMEIQLLNQLGQEVILRRFESLNQNNFHLDLSGISAGIYHVKVSADGEIYQGKIVVE